jgi:hypothetical protein
VEGVGSASEEGIVSNDEVVSHLRRIGSIHELRTAGKRVIDDQQYDYS